MKTLLIVILVTSFTYASEIQPAEAGSDEICDFFIRAEGTAYGSKDLFQYDDGSAHWLTNAGFYRGVRFETEDFYLYPIPWTLKFSEFWFYHHSSSPWDTDCFYAELWEGETSPGNLIDRQISNALHYTPTVVDYYPWIPIGSVFWLIVNTEFSGSGCPFTLCDDSPNFTGEAHSFYSHDFILWEPWTVGTTNLFRESWSTIKRFFR